jgi:hypothetical protein
MNKCEPQTKLINGFKPIPNYHEVQGDLITHRGQLRDKDTREVVGYMHSTCLVMYQDSEQQGMNLGTGVAELEIPDVGLTEIMFQGFFPTLEPHGNFELGILSSTGALHNAQGWIDMLMSEGGGEEGAGHPVVFHICHT